MWCSNASLQDKHTEPHTLCTFKQVHVAPIASGRYICASSYKCALHQIFFVLVMYKSSVLLHWAGVTWERILYIYIKTLSQLVCIITALGNLYRSLAQYGVLGNPESWPSTGLGNSESQPSTVLGNLEPWPSTVATGEPRIPAGQVFMIHKLNYV